MASVGFLALELRSAPITSLLSACTVGLLSATNEGDSGAGAAALVVSAAFFGGCPRTLPITSRDCAATTKLVGLLSATKDCGVSRGGASRGPALGVGPPISTAPLSPKCVSERGRAPMLSGDSSPAGTSRSSSPVSHCAEPEVALGGSGLAMASLSASRVAALPGGLVRGKV